MKKCLILLVFLSFFSLQLNAQKDNSDYKEVTREDLLSLKSVSGTSLSPDGNTIAFVEGGQIKFIPTKEKSAPVQVANGHSITWSPSGEAFAYIAMEKNTRKFQVYQYQINTGQIRQLTHVKEGLSPGFLDWSNTDKLVFTVRIAAKTTAEPKTSPPSDSSPEEGKPLIFDLSSQDGLAYSGIIPGPLKSASNAHPPSNELFVYDLQTGQHRQLTNDNADYNFPKWSPDGNSIACISNRGMGAGVLQKGLNVISLKDGARTILAPPGETSKLFPQWSPDGKKIAFVFHSFKDSKEHGIAIAELNNNRKLRSIKTLLSDITYDFTWAPDGKAIYTTIMDKVFQPVFRIDLKDKTRKAISLPRSVAFGPVSSKSGAIAWRESKGDTPSLIMFSSSEQRRAVDIYDPNPQVKSWNLGKQEVISWTNSYGHQRFGVLIKPVNYQKGKKYPLVVSAYSQGTHLNAFQNFAHGGFANQEFASKGYAVFFPGPRLPWMYGAWADSPEEAQLIKGVKGWDLTVDDIETGVDQLINLGIVDPNRMAITGHSNGGAASVAIITRTSRYKAATILAPAHLNWVDKILYSDNTEGVFIPPTTFLGLEKTFAEDPQTYIDGSLVFQTQSITTPTLLAIGENDHAEFTLPTLQLFLAMRRQKKDVQFLRYPNQGHNFYGPASKDLYDRFMAFIEERLR